MEQRRVLMATVNQWHSSFQVGSHHLARGFAQAGWEVAFVSEPISPWHLMGADPAELKDRYRIYKNGGIRDCNGRLWAYVPGALFTPHNKPFLDRKGIAKGWAHLSRPNLIQILR